MQDKKPDVPVSDESNLVIVATPEYVKEAIAEHAASRNHPYATHVEPGFVTLSNETDSDSELTAATSKTIKKTYDLASTANNNAINANSNAENRLAKNQNGADIPDKAAFVNNIGLSNVLRVGDYGLGGDSVELSSGQSIASLAGKTGFYSKANAPLPSDAPSGDGALKVLSMGFAQWPTQLAFNAYQNVAWIRTRESWDSDFKDWRQFLILDSNCHHDDSGYIRQSAPNILIQSDGKFTTNDKSEGATAERLSQGTYLIKGVKGFSNDEAVSSIDIPHCQNDLPIVWVNHEVLPDGSIKLMTYHREHSDAPAFARNIREGYSDGDLIDIPDGRFVSVRVQMPDVK
ncbi:phage tail fiber protein [Xenorhabdus sp. PB61.4]|uniref:phage tail fiber protein n=1 Tax=Xenorhabdus sp. PB61.4 TaxID=2788940 RepID=UPI001E39840F|nr:tail fiber protein [Xenorhabdus sp. PB61.4]